MKWGSRLYHFCKKWCLPCLGMPSAGLSEGSPTGKGHPCTPFFSRLGLTLVKALPTLPGTVDCFWGLRGTDVDLSRFGSPVRHPRPTRSVTTSKNGA